MGAATVWLLPRSKIKPSEACEIAGLEPRYETLKGDARLHSRAQHCTAASQQGPVRGRGGEGVAGARSSNELDL